MSTDYSLGGSGQMPYDPTQVPTSAPGQASGVTPPTAPLTPLQRQMIARGLMNLHPQQMQPQMLNLGNVQGNLPGGGVTSPYGVV